ncbi:hypothetical protein [Leptospira koniambonensis]|uniref:hypothetical protein n=1 Tax=Leptospira koniambonensis TaxID=2484950 RepID=UPI003EC05EC2
MSDIGINYDAKTQPSTINIQSSLAMSGNSVKVTIKNIGSFTLFITPTGNMAEQVVSGIAWPLAQYLSVTVVPPLIKDLIEGKEFEIFTINPSQQSVAGQTITITPDNLNLSNFNGMLLVQGNLKVG